MIDSCSDLARLLNGEQRRLANRQDSGPVARECVLRRRGSHRLVAGGADRAGLAVERLLRGMQLLVASFDALRHVWVVLLPPPQSTIRAAPQDVNTADENHAEDSGDRAVRLCKTLSTICTLNPCDACVLTRVPLPPVRRRVLVRCHTARLPRSVVTSDVLRTDHQERKECWVKRVRKSSDG